MWQALFYVVKDAGVGKTGLNPCPPGTDIPREERHRQAN